MLDMITMNSMVVRKIIVEKEFVMGLDMYFSAKKYMSKYFDKADVERIEKINDIRSEEHTSELQSH